MNSLFLIGCILVIAINGSELRGNVNVDCNGKFKDKSSCVGASGCEWCDAKAVPSACYTSEQAKSLPVAVFQCSGKNNDEKKKGYLDFTFHQNKEQKKPVEESLTIDETFLGKQKNDDEKLCDPNVDQHAGYFRLEEQNKHYFFWFFESRNDPANDPIILWLTGGPGCSSGIALLMENGPCFLKDGQTTENNPYSWNSNASIIYIDQPAGTGFSYGDHDSNEDAIGEDMYEFLKEFFGAFPKYLSNRFYIFGESYAGHYVPAVGHRIWRGNKEGGKPQINMKGISVGNGLTDPEIQVSSYADMAYKSGSAPPRVGAMTYNLMKYVGTPASVAAAKLCNNGGGDVSCTAAQEIWSLSLMTPIITSGYNHYDLRKKCEVPPMCYDFTDVTSFFNDPKVQKYLGVDKHWTQCDTGVHLLLAADFMKDYQQKIPELLEDGIKVLIYAGDQDYICNWLGNRDWTLALGWSGKDGFNKAQVETFKTRSGKAAGKVRSFKTLSFMQVFQAGHMVPMDQPEAALDMVLEFTKE